MELSNIEICHISTTRGAMELYYIPNESLQCGFSSHVYDTFPFFATYITLPDAIIMLVFFNKGAPKVSIQ